MVNYTKALTGLRLSYYYNDATDLSYVKLTFLEHKYYNTPFPWDGKAHKEVNYEERSRLETTAAILAC